MSEHMNNPKVSAYATAVATKDAEITRLSSEAAALRAELAAANRRADKEYVDHERTMRERDDHADLLDKFVHVVGGVNVCGEHSNLNDPWKMALAEVKSIMAARDAALAEVERVRGALKEAEVMMRGARSLIPDKRVYDAVLTEVQSALTPPGSQVQENDI